MAYEVLRNLTLISQIGITILTPIFVCTFIGLELEKRFDFPFTIPLLILGVMAGGYSAYKWIRKIIEKDEEKRQKKVSEVKDYDTVVPKKKSRIFKER